MAKRLRVVACSDFHCGELESLIAEPRVIDVLADRLNALSEKNAHFDAGIEEFIILGDLVDLSEAEDKDAYAMTKKLMKKLLAKVPIDRITFIPGNHDHHLWTEMCGAKSAEEAGSIVASGNLLADPPWFAKHCLPPGCTTPVSVAYPIHKVEENGSVFLFDHGHLFCLTDKVFTSVEQSTSLGDAETRAFSFNETLYYKTKSTFREKIYDFLRKVGGSLSSITSMRGTSFVEDSAPVYDDGLRERILWYLKDVCKFPADEMPDSFSLIFGHSHNGGRVLAADRRFRLHGRFINIWNTGGWLVTSKAHSPDAHIFFVERTPDGLRPDMYKLASKSGNEEGDYDRAILYERLARAGE